jgi:hypothetical protein
MYLSGSQKIQKSMNGILRISASEIDAENAYITNINDVQTINGKVGENLVIDVDTGQQIEFKDNTQMDSNLNVYGNLDVSGNTTLKALTVNELATFNKQTNFRDMIDVSRSSIFRQNLVVNGTFNSIGIGQFDSEINVVKHIRCFGQGGTVSKFDSSLNVDSNLHTNTFDVSGVSIFNGAMTTKGMTVGGVATFNSPIVANGTVFCRGMIDVSTSSIFRQNLVVNGTFNSIGIGQFDSEINVVKHIRCFGTGGTISRFDSNLNVDGNLHANTFDASGVAIFKNMIDVSMASIFRSNLVVNGTFNSIGIGQFDDDVNCFGRLRVTGATKSQIDSSLSILGSCDVSGNLYVGKNNPVDTSTLDVAGTIYLRDPTNPNVVYMTMRYDPAQFGFTFTDETPGRIMNFKLKNTGPGYSLFYFASSQLYAGMGVYCDAWLNLSYNKDFTLGDTNGTTWFGVSQMYTPNTATTSGHIIYNKGLLNNATYYTNFVHVNTSNVDVPTMRLSWENIWSKVNHVMEANLTLSSSGVTFNDSSVQTTAFTSAKNTKLIAIGGVTTATLSATTNLVTNTIFNCGSISLTAGTYIISHATTVDIITGSTIVNNLISAYSTSSTAFSQTTCSGRTDAGGFTYPVACVWSLNSTDTIVVASTTTYYLLVRATFGTASRIRYVNPNSMFKATRVA